MASSGHHADAEVELRHTLEIRPDHAPALNNLGLLLLKRGANEEASSLFNKAIRLRPGYARPHNNLGVVYLRQGRLDWAIAQFKLALLADPASQPAGRNLTSALAKLDPLALFSQQGYQQRWIMAPGGPTTAAQNFLTARIWSWFCRIFRR
ncbi:MAG: tetratricopeptide repeat protein [Cyanobacteria bacterium NC_groundwater_1444_Ag_S-0.65um_54_12]|nr:tetratricopeptide repeat protein [Cyanobacteria bacterium NC_groundwater_1444_Ag_S-0.65um_54_12]